MTTPLQRSDRIPLFGYGHCLFSVYNDFNFIMQMNEDQKLQIMDCIRSYLTQAISHLKKMCRNTDQKAGNYQTAW